MTPDRLEAIRESMQVLATTFEGELLAAVDRVRELHYETEGVHPHTVCAHVNCLDWSLDQHRWPCPTIQAMEGTDG